MARNYSRVFAILKDVNSIGIDLTYKEAVGTFTAGRTESLGDLSDFELKEFEKTLMLMVPENKKLERFNDANNDTRRAIISQFKSIGKTTADAIAWTEKYGVFGNKRKFNDYNGQELFQLLQNAKKMKADAITAVNKKLL
jgi:hypothetical protein